MLHFQRGLHRSCNYRRLGVLLASILLWFAAFGVAPKAAAFEVVEATIDDIQQAILSRQLTTVQLLQLYLARVKAYNGRCVNEPQGILGPITTIPHAGQINALTTLNLRPASRAAWGFDVHHARSQTDLVDNNAIQPDALEIAAKLDRFVALTGHLIGPLHGVVIAIKDQYDTFDMRTTSGATAFYGNDRPPTDATVVARLRAAGAIILAKSNMGEYASGGRSGWGGTNCNVYDTQRASGGSSAGSGTSVSANLVTCAIGEETGGSILSPSRNNGIVGIPPTRELMSASGMIQQGVNTRVGPMCRTVVDTARVLDVIAGYDPNDELTAFSVGRIPAKPSYSRFAVPGRLDGVRIGVVREFMDKSLMSSVAHFEAIDLIEKAIQDIRALGATIVDPGAGGALFKPCIDKVVPAWRNRLFVAQFPAVFPSGTDFIPTLVDMYINPPHVPHTSTGSPSLRNIGPTTGDTGGAKFNFDWYLLRRGDPQMQTLGDLINKAVFYSDPNFSDRKASLVSNNADTTLATDAALQNRFAVQTLMHECFAEQNLDAVLYPSSTLPPKIMTNGNEPTANDWSGSSTFPSNQGLPAITVPAGYTTQAYDRDPNGNLLPPVAASLPIGIEFLALPFDEPTLFRIAAAYEAATHHRIPPADFGPL